MRKISALQPPPIDNLGNSSGFSFRLQDRAQRGYVELMAREGPAPHRRERESHPAEMSMSKGWRRHRRSSSCIDREKAAALGVTFQDINSTISTNLGSAYINDFPNRGRMQRVIVQADNAGRMQTDDILTFNVRNSKGNLVPFSSFATIRWIVGPTQMVGFNYYPAVRDQRLGQAGIHERRRHCRDGAHRRQPAARLRLRMDGAVSAGEAGGVAGSAAPRTFRAGGVPAACSPVRELDDSDLGSPGGAARHAGRGGGRDAAGHAERRLLHHSGWSPSSVSPPRTRF